MLPRASVEVHALGEESAVHRLSLQVPHDLVPPAGGRTARTFAILPGFPRRRLSRSSAPPRAPVGVDALGEESAVHRRLLKVPQDAVLDARFRLRAAAHAPMRSHARTPRPSTRRWHRGGAFGRMLPKKIQQTRVRGSHRFRCDHHVAKETFGISSTVMWTRSL